MKHKVKTIKVPFDKLDKIFQVSDIHIRLVRRHQEYKDVFQSLYEDILQSDKNNSIIFVAGDLLHSKTDLSPEIVGLASDFLRCLSEIMPTIVIAGNHDANIANPNRLDSLSPIVDNIKSPNLHYLRNSGIYRIADIDFGVFSVFGDKKTWPTADELTSNTKVALFHGPVNNAKTDVGYVITNRHVTPSLFAGYDMVLMGDIHKHQVMQEYNPKLGKPIMVYGGSLIQQSHGEDAHGHGYLIWNVSKRNFKFKEIYNVCGFHTLLIENGKMPNISDIPDNVRLRLFVHNTDTSVIKKIVTMLRKNLNVQELTVNRVVAPSLSDQNKSVMTNFTDVKTTTFQNKLIRDYLEEHFPQVDEDTLARVDEINTELNAKITDEDMSRNIHWRPLHFKFNNMFSYGEENEINFEDMRGIYGLFSPNASGKTAALDALMFCLFDKTPRAFKASHIMNNRKNKFECSLRFEVDGEIFGIKRIGIRNKKGDVKVGVDFWKEQGNRIISLNGEDRRDTNAAVRLYIGNYDDFILTNISVQNNGALFVDKSQSERKDLLGQFMGLDIFDKLHTIASDEMKETAGALKKFSKDDFTETLARTQSDIEIQNEIYKDLEIEVRQKVKSRDELDNKIRELYEKKVPLNITETDISKLEKKFEQYQIQSHSTDVEINEITGQIEEQKFAIKQNKELLSEYDVDLLNRNVKLRQDAYLEKVDFTNQLKVLNSNLESMEVKLKHLQEYEYDPNCKFCINNIFVKDAKKTEKDIQKYREEVENIEKKLEAASLQYDKYIDAGTEFNDYESISKLLTKFETEFQRSRAELMTLHNDKSKLSIKISEIQELIRKYNESIDLIEKNIGIQDKINSLETDKEILVIDINKVEKNLRKIHGEIEVLRFNKREMIKSIKDAEDLEETYAAYEYYIAAINRDGVPYDLISKVIPNIEAEINNILTQIVDFTIVLEVDGKNINGKLVYDMDKVWPLELSSGMERFISSLAIRVALLNVSNLPKSNFLVVDEGLGTLDADNLSSMNMMFSILKAQFDWIILISHLDSVRDITENLIEIKRENGYSQIQIT